MIDISVIRCILYSTYLGGKYIRYCQSILIIYFRTLIFLFKKTQIILFCLLRRYQRPDLSTLIMRPAAHDTYFSPLRVRSCLVAAQMSTSAGLMIVLTELTRLPSPLHTCMQPASSQPAILRKHDYCFLHLTRIYF